MLIDTREPPPEPGRRQGPEDWRPWGWALGTAGALTAAASTGGAPGLALAVAGVVGMFRTIGSLGGGYLRGLGEWHQ